MIFVDDDNRAGLMFGKLERDGCSHHTSAQNEVIRSLAHLGPSFPAGLMQPPPANGPSSNRAKPDEPRSVPALRLPRPRDVHPHHTSRVLPQGCGIATIREPGA